jgi:hypothetical protein
MYGLQQLGELSETRLLFRFTDDRMEVTVTPHIFGGEPVVISGGRR